MKVPILYIALAIALAGCHRLSPQSDSEIVEQFQENYQAFDDAVLLVTTQPEIRSMVKGPNGGLTSDAGVLNDKRTGLSGEIDRRTERAEIDQRIDLIWQFMRAQKVRQIENKPGNTPFVRFRVSGRFSKRQKDLVYTTSSPVGKIVSDTDVAATDYPDTEDAVYRSLGNGWYIASSCCQAGGL